MSTYVKLKNIATLKYGDPLVADVRNESGHYNVYGSNGVVGRHDQPNTRGKTIIVGRKGSYGKVLYSSEPVFVIDTAYSIDEATAKVDLRWLYYALQTLDLEGSSLDTGVPGLSRDFAHNSKLRLVPNDEQKRVAEYLDNKTALIDKILTAKKHTHTQLADLRMAIIAGAVRGGVAMTTPRVRLKTIARVLNGATPKSDNPDFWDGSIYWATPIDLSRLNDKFIETTQRKITEAGYESCNTTLVEPGNIVISNRAPIGLVAINKVPLCTNQGCKALLLDKQKVDATYLYYYLLSIKDALQNLGVGTTFMEISSDAIKNIEVPLPPIEEQRSIARWLDNKMDIIRETNDRLSASIRLLEEYRTSLISNVITGKVEL